jgi:hypothetical protein
MKKIVLTETQAVAVRDATQAGNETFAVWSVHRPTTRALYAKGLIDQPGYGAHLNDEGKDVARQLREHPRRRTFHVQDRPPVLYRIQPEDRVDGMSVEHGARYQRPWPVGAYADGSVLGADDQWCGKVTRVIGFQADLARKQIDLSWSDFLLEPQKAVGMYLVTSDSEGTWGVHDTAVESITEQAAQRPVKE